MHLNDCRGLNSVFQPAIIASLGAVARERADPVTGNYKGSLRFPRHAVVAVGKRYMYSTC
jgi:hypothetical protein